MEELVTKLFTDYTGFKARYEAYKEELGGVVGDTVGERRLKKLEGIVFGLELAVSRLGYAIEDGKLVKR